MAKTQEQKAAANRANVSRWRTKNPKRAADANRKKLYGLSSTEYDFLLLIQHGNCAICERPMDKPHVDHDHDTGFVRGLLCKTCNLGIGHLKDDPNLLRAGAVYLGS